jgi:hypothetical protein
VVVSLDPLGSLYADADGTGRLAPRLTRASSSHVEKGMKDLVLSKAFK